MKIFRLSKTNDEFAGREALRRAVRATRRTSAEAVLSASSRDRILDASRNQADPSPSLFPSLFAAPRRLFAVGALPLILAAGLLVLLNQRDSV
ncbi:MAG: hypothetical protein DRJ50_03915, partial [Actinobacteria bacterium]